MLEAGKSKISWLADLASGENSLPGSQTAIQRLSHWGLGFNINLGRVLHKHSICNTYLSHKGWRCGTNVVPATTNLSLGLSITTPQFESQNFRTGPGGRHMQPPHFILKLRKLSEFQQLAQDTSNPMKTSFKEIFNVLIPLWRAYKELT